MGKKRKAEATRLDEVDRTLYSAFCSAANSVSQIYTQAMANQKLAFQAGERHALEKLYQLILRNSEEGSRANVADIVAYLQREIDSGDDESVSPSIQLAHQQLSSNMHQPNATIQNPPCVVGSVAIGDAHQTDNVLPQANGARNHERNFVEKNQEPNSLSVNDSSMDMHSDSPPHGTY